MGNLDFSILVKRKDIPLVIADGGIVMYGPQYKALQLVIGKIITEIFIRKR